MALSDSRPGRRLNATLRPLPSPATGLPRCPYHLSGVPCPLPRPIERVHLSIPSPFARPSPFLRRVGVRIFTVESRCGAVSVGRTYLFPPLSSGGTLVVRPWLRFHIPLIEPDVQISRIRLSDKTSRLCFGVRRHLRV